MATVNTCVQAETAIRCIVCGQTPLEKGLEPKYKKDGSESLPFRWIKTDDGIVCSYDRESTPTINYVYDCSTPAPLDAAIRQLRLAGKYRNALCAIEIERRGKVDAYIAETFPELQSMEQEITDLDAEQEAIRTAIKARRQKRVGEDKLPPKRLPPTEEEKNRLDAIKAQLKELYAARKSLREDAFGSATTKAALRAIEDDAKTQIKAARAEFREQGLTWGTGGAVERAAGSFRTGAPPRFARSADWSQMALQIQGGIDASDTIDDSRFAIQRLDRKTKGGQHYRCKVLVSPAAAAEYVEVEFVMHRPFPEGSRIKFVYLENRKVGTKWYWQLRFAVQLASAKSAPDDGSVLWLAPSWKLLKEGLRVAVWQCGDKEDELVLPVEWLDQRQTVDDLDSIADTLFNEYRDTLAAWLYGDPLPMFVTERLEWLVAKNNVRYQPEIAALRGLRDSWVEGEKTLPESLAESVKFLTRWRSAARLASLVLRWRDNRFDGDEAILEAMEQWRRRDKHLTEWQGNLRRKLIARRNQLYRCFAKRLADDGCVSAMVKKLDLKKLEAEPVPEEMDVHPGRKYGNWLKRFAAAGTLIQYLGEAMRVERMAPAEFDSASGLVMKK